MKKKVNKRKKVEVWQLKKKLKEEMKQSVEDRVTPTIIYHMRSKPS